MTITPDDLVRREVHYCVSSLVSTLATTPLPIVSQEGNELCTLIEQAQELTYPIDDWEEAAIQAGWEYEPQVWTRAKTDSDPNPDDGNVMACATAEQACEIDDIEPYQREVFEHWIVSDWLADKLAEKGEKVDKDFAGLTVWARTTTGQGIASDGVIQHIAAEINAA